MRDWNKLDFTKVKEGDRFINQKKNIGTITWSTPSALTYYEETAQFLSPLRQDHPRDHILALLRDAKVYVEHNQFPVAESVLRYAQYDLKQYNKSLS